MFGWGQPQFDPWGNPIPQGNEGWGPGFGGGAPMGMPGMGMPGMGPPIPPPMMQPPTESSGWGQEPPVPGGWAQQGGWEGPPPQGPPGGFGNQGGWGEESGGGGWGQGYGGGVQGGGGGFGEYGGMGGMGGMGGGFGESGGMGGFGGNLMADWFKQQNIVPIIHVKKKAHNSHMLGNQEWGDSNLFGGWLAEQKKMNQYQIVGPQADVANFVNEQIIFIEPSPVQQKLQQLRMKGLTFNDNMFPANQKSLTGEWGNVGEWTSIKWKRISQLLQNPQIFHNKIAPDDIKQGALGDCYFLAALAALAENPARIANLFLTQQQNPQRYYAVKLLYKGKWKTIDLDEYVPAIGNSPAFSKAVGPETWVVLLEKAWAKLYSSYKRIQAGYAEEGLHDLTGAHIQAYRTKAADFNKEEVWRYLKEGEERGYSMIASSQPGSDTNTSTTGVVLGHAYTLLSAVELNANGSMNRLIKLRNPWGKTEANTAWNDNDPRWNYVSEYEKQKIGFVRNTSDGTFFMDYNDFCKDFRMITSAEVNDNASYIYFTQKTTQKKGCYFRVQILKQGEYSFQVNQIPQRAFEDKLQESYDYVSASILIGRLTGPNRYEWYEGSQSAFRTLFKKHRLPAGQYIVFSKIRFDPKWEKDYEVTLAIYGESPCRISAATPNEGQTFKQLLYAGKAMKNPQTARPGVFYSQEILKEGYLYAACINQSQAPITVNLNVQNNDNPTVQLKKPFRGQRQISQRVLPGDYLTILARVTTFKYTTRGLGQLSFN